MTTASNAHKHVAAVLKNVEEWLGNNHRATSIFLILVGIISLLVLLLLPPSPPYFCQMNWVL